MLLNSMRGGKKKKKHKIRTRTESCEKEREGIMWAVMSTRHAERGMRGRERENNRERGAENHEETSIKVLSFCCAQQHPTHSKGDGVGEEQAVH